MHPVAQHRVAVRMRGRLRGSKQVGDTSKQSCTDDSNLNLHSDMGAAAALIAAVARNQHLRIMRASPACCLTHTRTHPHDRPH